MSIWHNPTTRTLNFKLRDEMYEVVPGAEVTLPDFLDWLPPSRGLPLVLGTSPMDKAPRAIPKMPPSIKRPLPEGVTAGPNAVLREQREDEIDDDGPDDDDEESDTKSPTVTKAVEQLQKQGVRVPGKR